MCKSPEAGPCPACWRNRGLCDRIRVSKREREEVISQSKRGLLGLGEKLGFYPKLGRSPGGF